MRLQKTLVGLFVLSAVAAASAVWAGPLYLTSEPGMVMPAEPVLGDTEFGRPASEAAGEIELVDRGPAHRVNASNVRDGVSVPVPEPGSLLLLGAGLAVAAVARRRRRILHAN